MPQIDLTPSECCYLARLVRKNADTPERIGMAPNAEAAVWQCSIDLALALKLLADPKPR